MFRIHFVDTATGRAFTVYRDDAKQVGDTVADALRVSPGFRITISRQVSQ